MTGEELRAELERASGGAPTIDVPTDLYDRGRRAHRRAQVLGAAVVVGCLALVGGAAFRAVTADETPVADGVPAVGVPDHIYAPPDGELDLDLTPLDQVGPAAAAYRLDDPDGRVVLVSPEGEYDAVALPRQYEPMLDEVSPLLSPDGLHLAYTTHHNDTRGLAVAHLDSGEVTYLGLSTGLGSRTGSGALVSAMQWSPDSRWIVWNGQVVTSLSDNRASYGRAVAGVVRRDARLATVLPTPRPHQATWHGAGVCEDGSAVRHVWPAYFTSDGDRSVQLRSWQEVESRHGACSAPRSYLRVGLGPHSRLLGWLPASSDDQGPTGVIVVPNWTDDSRESFDGMSLRLIRTDGTARTVGSAESGWVGSITVATGLMTEDRPTVPAGENPWDRPFWVDHPVWTVFGGLAVLLGAVAAVGWLRRRTA